MPQLLFERALYGLQVGDAMRTRFECVDPETPLHVFVDDYLLRSNQLVWPVQRGGQVLGIVTLNQISRIRSDGAGGLRVAGGS